MASAGNIGLTRLPWGKLPRSPVNSRMGGTSQLEMSFQDIMAEQERENQSKDKEFEEYVEKSFVKVGNPKLQTATPESSQTEKSGDKDVEVDPKMVMSLYEDQDFEDAAYEISEQELDEMAEDDTDNYYEGLAKKLSTVVEIQSSSRGNKGNRTNCTSSIRQVDPEAVIDPQSKVTLDKLKRKGIIREPVSSTANDKLVHVGRSATVLYALGGMLKRRDESPSTISIVKLRLPKELAVKVFRSSSEDTDTSNNQSQLDAMKEMTNLNRMSRAGVPCPQVQFLCGNILVTDFLGKDGVPAKKLIHVNDLSTSRSILKSAYEQVTNHMKTLFKTCNLVHGNIVENVLWYKRQACIIGVSNAVNSNKPKSLDLLYRDCVNITKFFETKGITGCRQPHQLFHSITGFDFTGDLYHEAASIVGDDEHEDFTIV